MDCCCHFSILTARSLRLIQDAGDFCGHLDLPRLARSTTSDALAVFDPVHLKPMIRDLQRRVPELARQDPGLLGISQRIIAADGTYMTTLANVAWALHHTKSSGKKQGQVRANVQMDVATWVPQVITLSGQDHQSEAAAFTPDLLQGVLYVVDRNFLDFAFLKALRGKNSDFILRIRSNAPAVRIMQARELSAEDVGAGVVSDEVVELTGKDAPTGPLRRVMVHAVSREGKTQVIGLLTSLSDDKVQAHVIAQAYRLRWQIELFFKWFKCWARMDHLLSATRNGITFQLYVAVIAVLLMYIQTGKRVSRYALAALSRVAHGQLTLDQAMAVIARREHERQLNNARQARKRAMKNHV